MSDVSVLPGTLAVRNLFEDLLGREVTVSPGDPISAEEIATATVAIFTDTSQKVYGVLGMDLPLAANAGAALGLLPAGAAEDSIDEKQLFPNLAENVFELCNVLTSLLNRKGGPHIKLYRGVPRRRAAGGRPGVPDGAGPPDRPHGRGQPVRQGQVQPRPGFLIEHIGRT